jgi:hypothetical protein
VSTSSPDSGSTNNDEGGGSSNGGPTAVSSLCGGAKTLGETLGTNLVQLCNDTATYFGNTISTAIGCKWAALQIAASPGVDPSKLQSACMETENTCLQRGAVSGIVGQQIVVVLPEEGDCLGGVESTCTATVLQYCACITDETSALVQTVNGLPDCATLQTTDIASIMTAEGTSLPASCMAISNACSGVEAPNPWGPQ